MAYSQSSSPNATYRDVYTHQVSTPQVGSSVLSSPIQQHPRQTSKQRFVADLSQCLFDFVIQLLPTQEEMAVKEDVRKLLERLIRTIEPDSRLLSFGSTANGFSLRNSDMDLCCLIDSEDKLAAADLVTMLGDLLERETKFHVKTLPHARIPIVKLTLDPSPGLPHGIACDIGFENRLALENTRLLMCYAMIDPTRVRTLVLFLKVWSKRRKINSPYKGTLSSYGYVLLVIYFLVHVKNPPVLPNLQQMPPLRPITKEETHLNGFNIWFFDDIDLLRQRWVSENTDSVADLLIDFFRYYAREFQYNTGVASIRAGLLKKEAKGWQNDYSGGRYDPSRERNRLCIEDPFELDYNVARCVTKDGLYTIRGEFMRAARVLATRPDRAIVALAELCEERKDEELVSAPVFAPSRPPPQTPYTVGSHSMRPKGAAERLSPPSQFFNPATRTEAQQQPQEKQITAASNAPPEHMAPKRSKWTSPPPPEACSEDRTRYENQLDKGLQLATSSTEARQTETASSWASETNSEVFTDEDRSDAAESDDIISVKSYTEGADMNATGPTRRPSWHVPDGGRLPQFLGNVQAAAISNGSTGPAASGPSRQLFKKERSEPQLPSTVAHATNTPFRPHIPEFVPTAREFASSSRRPLAGPARAFKSGGPVWTSHTPVAVNTPLPPSQPESPMEPPTTATQATVFYQTPPLGTRSPRPVAYSSPLLSHYTQSQQSPHSPHAQSSLYSQQQPSSSSPRSASPYMSYLQQQQHAAFLAAQVPPDILPVGMGPGLTSSLNPRGGVGRRMNSGPETPTPGSYGHSQRHEQAQVHHQQQQQHQQQREQTTASSPVAIAGPPPIHVVGVRSESVKGVAVPAAGSVSSPSPSSPPYGGGLASPEGLGSPAAMGSRKVGGGGGPGRRLSSGGGSTGSTSPPTGSSPSPSSSTGYATSISRSPSPRSPSPNAGPGLEPPGTAIPIKGGGAHHGGRGVRESVHDDLEVFSAEFEGLGVGDDDEATERQGH